MADVVRPSGADLVKAQLEKLGVKTLKEGLAALGLSVVPADELATRRSRKAKKQESHFKLTEEMALRVKELPEVFGKGGASAEVVVPLTASLAEPLVGELLVLRDVEDAVAGRQEDIKATFHGHFDRAVGEEEPGVFFVPKHATKIVRQVSGGGPVFDVQALLELLPEKVAELDAAIQKTRSEKKKAELTEKKQRLEKAIKKVVKTVRVTQVDETALFEQAQEGNIPFEFLGEVSDYSAKRQAIYVRDIAKKDDFSKDTLVEDEG